MAASPPHGVPPRLLEPVLARRETLRAAIDHLERALAAPAHAPGWQDGVRSAMIDLRGAYNAHVSAAEGPGGIAARMVEASPRLAGPVRMLEAEHIDLETLMVGLEDCCSAAEPDPQVIRDRGVEVIDHLLRHRQKGSDLFYESFQAELGGMG
jgi:hypothetical protein